MKKGSSAEGRGVRALAVLALFTAVLALSSCKAKISQPPLEPFRFYTPTPVCGGVLTFPDANLEAAVRAAVSKPTGDLLASDLAPVTELIAYGQSISDLRGLECWSSLRTLELGSNLIVNLAPLAGLIGLTELHLDSNQISDLSPLVGLTGLQELWLSNNYISDLSALAGLTVLYQIRLDHNSVVSITPLVTNAQAGGIGTGDVIDLTFNPLGSQATGTDIPFLVSRGAYIYH